MVRAKREADRIALGLSEKKALEQAAAVAKKDQDEVEAKSISILRVYQLSSCIGRQHLEQPHGLRWLPLLQSCLQQHSPTLPSGFKQACMLSVRARAPTEHTKAYKVLYTLSLSPQSTTP